MPTTTRTTMAIAKTCGVVGLALALVLLAGCDDAAPTAPPPPRLAQERASTTRAAAPTATTTPSAAAPTAPSAAAPTSAAPAGERTPRAAADAATTLAGDVLAPTGYAPAFGLAVGDGLAIDVDPDSGDATFFEVDVELGFAGLRRARTGGVDRTGLFGRGWRSELESSVTLGPGGAPGVVVRRIQGVSFFAPSGVDADTYVSVLGEVEVLRRDAAGWTLVQGDGRVLGFDRDGRVDLLDGATIERAPGRVTLTGAEGRRVEIALDARGRATRVTGDHVALSYGYDAAGELVTVGGDRSRAYTIEAGRVTRVGSAGATLVVAAYDATSGRVSRFERADGWTQDYAFASASDGAPEAAVMTPHGRFVFALRAEAGAARWDMSTPRGEERAWFDVRGRIVARQRTGEARETIGAGDAAPIAATSTAEPDAVGGPTSTEQAGARESFTWDAAGRLAAATGADGRETRHEYDARGRIAADVFPSGRASYAWDAQDRLTSVTTPAGRTWTFGWDERRLVRQDGPMGPVELEHDHRGGLSARHDASGREWTAAHDEPGRATLIQAASGEAVTFERDSRGRLVLAEGPSGRIVLAHGATDERVRVTDEATGVALDYAVEDAITETVGTPWGALRRSVRGATVTRSTPAGDYRFEHDGPAPSGARVSVSYPGGLTVTTAHDARGHVTGLVARRGDETLVEVASTWDARQERTSSTRDGVETRYTHDAAGRLATLTRDGESRRWSYDADHARVLESRSAGGHELARRATLDARGRLVRLGDETFTHDAAGRLTERHHGGDTDRFAYDGFGRLSRVERAGSPAVEWTRDALGRIATRTVLGKTTRYVHDGDQLLAELRADGSSRVWLNGIDTDEPLGFVDLAPGQSFADALAAGRKVDLVLDDQGHGLLAIDGHGVVTRLAVDPWGVPESAVSTDDRAVPAVFAGRLYDPIARVYDLRARAYDPALGRFLTPDPAGLCGGLDPWTYCEGRPLDRTDPMGLWSFSGLLESARDSVVNTASSVADTVVGAGEGLGYLLGVHGDAAAIDAARTASVEDVTSGRAQSRALGALDAYTQSVTCGLIDPNTSRFAFDPAEAQRGRVYGEAGGVAFAIVSAAPMLRAAPGVLWSGVRALPRLPAALASGLRAAPSLPGRLLSVLGAGARGARALPGRALEALRWVASNPRAIGRAVASGVRAVGGGARSVGGQVYNVTLRPFVSGAEALLRRSRQLADLVRRAASPAAELAEAAGSAEEATQVGRALGVATGIDDAARAATGAADEVAQATGATPARQAASAAPDAAAPAPAVPPTNGLVQALGDDARASTATPARVGTQPQAPRAPPHQTIPPGQWRGRPSIADGNGKAGWQHIEERHVTGTKPGGDLFAEGTTRAQLQEAAETIVQKGVRVTEDATERLQVFRRRITINGQSDPVKVVVDTQTGEVVTMFPARDGTRASR